MQCNICLDAFTAANGATLYVPGSFATRSPPPRAWNPGAYAAAADSTAGRGAPFFPLRPAEARAMEAPAGSILMYHSGTWHRIAVNSSAAPRVGVAQSFYPDFVAETRGVAPGAEPAPGGGAAPKVKFTGLTQNSQVDPEVRLKIPINALELTQILGRPCKFQVPGRAERVALRGYVAAKQAADRAEWARWAAGPTAAALSPRERHDLRALWVRHRSVLIQMESCVRRCMRAV
jgi:hypothetical protein